MGENERERTRGSESIKEWLRGSTWKVVTVVATVLVAFFGYLMNLQTRIQEGDNKLLDKISDIRSDVKRELESRKSEVARQLQATSESAQKLPKHLEYVIGSWKAEGKDFKQEAASLEAHFEYEFDFKITEDLEGSGFVEVRLLGSDEVLHHADLHARGQAQQDGWFRFDYTLSGPNGGSNFGVALTRFNKDNTGFGFYLGQRPDDPTKVVFGRLKFYKHGAHAGQRFLEKSPPPADSANRPEIPVSAP